MAVDTFNIDKFLKRIMGAKFRKSKSHFFWLRSLIKPVSTTNISFLQFKNKTEKELSYTNQTIQIERMLNDKFDNILRRILVLHSTNTSEFDFFISEGQNPDFDYFISEAQPLEHYFFVGENTSTIGGFDFLVKIPASLNNTDTINQMKGEINILKLASKTFDVTT